MPCRVDNWEDPSRTRLHSELSKVFSGLDELIGAGVPRSFWKSHPGVGDHLDKQSLDYYTAKLCEKLQVMRSDDIKELSLELQMWWRDHQEADKLRIEKELAEKRAAADREFALGKLSDYEKQLLGLKP